MGQGRVGLVVVCHSPALAQAAVDLALAMVPTGPPSIVLAAGTADGRIGTDPMRVAAAIAGADSGAGVVVLSDLGSAVLSAEMALELIDPGLQVRVVAAPFVEGLLAAVVRAAGGAALEQVATAARDALEPKRAHLEAAPPPETEARTGNPILQTTLRLVNAEGMHARPAAAIAALLAPFKASITLSNARGQRADAASPIALGLLQAAAGEALSVSAWGDEAEAAVEALKAACAAGFGEALVESPSTPAEPAPPTETEPGFPRRGLGVSPGRAWGPVRRIAGPPSPPAPSAPLAPAKRSAAAAALQAACGAVIEELHAQAAAAPDQRGAVLMAIAALAADPTLANELTRAVLEEGLNAEEAWWRALTRIAADYRAAGGRAAERAIDLLDLRDRVIRRLRGMAQPERNSTEPAIWVADELPATDLANLTPGSCLGLVSEGGGSTSHSAILARELGIPAVVGARGITALADGTLLLLDGSSGELVVNPDAGQRASAMAAPLHRSPEDPAEALAGPVHSADGTPILLLANAADVDDADAALAWGAEGIGLLRTEFCFQNHRQEPSSAEQEEHYGRILAVYGGRRVVIRTFDAGSDKPLPFIGVDPEHNPALGLRGFRTTRRWPEVLNRQLQAIAAAARASDAEVWVMAPMISTATEAADFMARARAVGLKRAGVMVETPAAALVAEELSGLVDFLSVGTNDLAQFTMAADRSSAALADLRSPWQPALLRLIAMVTRAAAARDVPVGVCGEAAACPALAAVLVGLGATSLSMTRRALTQVAATLRAVTIPIARQAAAAALGSATAEAAEAAARAVISQPPRL